MAPPSPRAASPVGFEAASAPAPASAFASAAPAAASAASSRAPSQPPSQPPSRPQSARRPPARPARPQARPQSARPHRDTHASAQSECRGAGGTPIASASSPPSHGPVAAPQSQRHPYQAGERCSRPQARPQSARPHRDVQPAGAVVSAGSMLGAPSGTARPPQARPHSAQPRRPQVQPEGLPFQVWSQAGAQSGWPRSQVQSEGMSFQARPQARPQSAQSARPHSHVHSDGLPFQARPQSAQPHRAAPRGGAGGGGGARGAEGGAAAGGAAVSWNRPAGAHGQARRWVPESGKGERAPSGEPLFVVYGTTSRHIDRRVVLEL